jgi:hypothetical protein
MMMGIFLRFFTMVYTLFTQNMFGFLFGKNAFDFDTYNKKSYVNDMLKYAELHRQNLIKNIKLTDYFNKYLLYKYDSEIDITEIINDLKIHPLMHEAVYSDDGRFAEILIKGYDNYKYDDILFIPFNISKIVVDWREKKMYPYDYSGKILKLKDENEKRKLVSFVNHYTTLGCHTWCHYDFMIACVYATMSIDKKSLTYQLVEPFTRNHLVISASGLKGGTCAIDNLNKIILPHACFTYLKREHLSNLIESFSINFWREKSKSNKKNIKFIYKVFDKNNEYHKKCIELYGKIEPIVQYVQKNDPIGFKKWNVFFDSDDEIMTYGWPSDHVERISIFILVAGIIHFLDHEIASRFLIKHGMHFSPSWNDVDQSSSAFALKTIFGENIYEQHYWKDLKFKDKKIQNWNEKIQKDIGEKFFDPSYYYHCVNY